MQKSINSGEDITKGLGDGLKNYRDTENLNYRQRDSIYVKIIVEENKTRKNRLSKNDELLLGGE